MEQILGNQLLQAAQKVEEHLDSEIQKLDNLDDDDLDKIREKRMKAIKKAQEQKQEWISKGHGVLTELPSEKDFFEASKSSKNIVCHFYRNTTFRCKIFDKHLEILAKKHLETKFLKLNVEKAPFLTERLKIKVIPTLALIVESKTKDYVVGFDDLGNCDDFSTEMLEWRLGCSKVINYAGDLMTPPDSEKGKAAASKNAAYLLGGNRGNKSIRGSNRDDSDDSDFD